VGGVGVDVGVGVGVGVGVQLAVEDEQTLHGWGTTALLLHFPDWHLVIVLIAEHVE